MFDYQRVFKIVAEYCRIAVANRNPPSLQHTMVLPTTPHRWKAGEVDQIHWSPPNCTQIFMNFHDISLHLTCSLVDPNWEKKTCWIRWMSQFHLSFRLALLLPLRAAAWLRHRQRRRLERRRAAQQQGRAGGEENHLERQENLGGFHHGLGCL